MKKLTLALFLLPGFLHLANKAIAQKCGTVELQEKLAKQHPEITKIEEDYKKKLSSQLAKMDFKSLYRSTTSDNMVLHIPVVVHIMHSYGSEYIYDSAVVNMVKEMNTIYNLQNDTSDIIQPFKKYVGNAHIQFHLATKDPVGRPTIGITRRMTYLTNGGDDQAKMDQWSNANYLNIWIENNIGLATDGGTVLAYAYKPPAASVIPYYDGLMCGYRYIHFENTVSHEVGHYLNLDHPWNSSGASAGTAGACGDDDVDDTPPTIGHFSTCPLYDTACATNYFKTYFNPDGSSYIINYPDTTNVQNIMDYSSCTNMFTKGQVDRMRKALLVDSLAFRHVLVSDFNTEITGALANRPDLPAIPDFYPTVSNKMQYFTCPGTTVKIFNRTWGDTLTNLQWQFGGGASVDDTVVTSASALGYNGFVNNTFSQAGWATLTMKATGNNTAESTKTWEKAIYVADNNAISTNGYFQEFAPGGDRDKWPLFNYYNNEFSWEFANVGLYDNYCLKYNGFDNRVNPRTGSPKGDFDDVFSIPVDLSEYAGAGACNLNFFSSGASRTSMSPSIKDTFEISYSTDKAKTWTVLKVFTKSDLINKGTFTESYVPTSSADWVAKTVNIPEAARKSYVVFRMRYKPGVDHYGFMSSTGNNFYIDRIHFSSSTADISGIAMQENTVVVAPNPTSTSAFIVMGDIQPCIADVIVTDITGKLVYKTQENVSNGSKIEIPQNTISTKGIYLVQTITGNKTYTQKLVVN